VGLDDVLPQILWTRYFLEEQGYVIRDSIVGQDNQSAMLLENNGLASSGKRTRHINVRYFFVKDQIESGDMHVAYCPTEWMIADFFTKPLQGIALLKFRNLILNIDSPFDKAEDRRSVLDGSVSHNAIRHTMTTLASLACQARNRRSTGDDTVGE